MAEKWRMGSGKPRASSSAVNIVDENDERLYAFERPGSQNWNTNYTNETQENIYQNDHHYVSRKPSGMQQWNTGPRFKKDTPALRDQDCHENSTLKGELLDSIHEQNFDTIAAAFVLLKYHQNGIFNPSQYTEFLDDQKVKHVSRFDEFAPLLPEEVSNHPSANVLEKLRQKLKDDINLALIANLNSSIIRQNEKLAKEFDLRANRDLSFSRSYLDGSLIIPEDEVFKLLISSWPAPPEHHSAYDKLFSATKYILSQITKEVGGIAKYTHTFSGNRARKYPKLPDHVINTVGEMMMQLSGTGDAMLLESEDEAKQKFSSKWSNLANDEAGRCQKFNLLKELKEKVMDAKNKTIIEALNELRRSNLENLAAGGHLKRKATQ